VLLAPCGQLSADGQLRELIEERRDRHDGTGPIWYLQPDQVAALGLGCGEEAVVTNSAAVLTWFQLRFGGRTNAAPLSTALAGCRSEGSAAKRSAGGPRL